MLIDDIVNSEFGGVQNRAATAFGKAASQIARWVGSRAAVVDGEVYVPVRRKSLNIDEVPEEERAKVKPFVSAPATWIWFDGRWYRKTHASVPFKGSTLPPPHVDLLDPNRTRNPREPITPVATRNVALSEHTLAALEAFRDSVGLSTHSEAVAMLLGVSE